jgi:hypothetical protein
MRRILHMTFVLRISTLVVFLLFQAQNSRCQEAGIAASGAASEPFQKSDLAAIGSLLYQLQSEVRDLRGEVNTLKLQQDAAQMESARLRQELEQTKSELVARTGSEQTLSSQHFVPAGSAAQEPIQTQLDKLKEEQQLADAKIAEQSQSKVESGSKYRVRLSGIVLFNTFSQTGYVDNVDFPQLLLPMSPLSSERSFGASVRQSQIGIQAFGPTIAGARTSADIQFDFAGGFPETQNGTSFGIMRLRTGTIRFDWTNTSVVGGQDSLFFAPLSPTSMATLAIPALAYSGNLWSWTPQIRAEHKFAVSDSSTVLVQGGILDNLSGDVPESTFYRSPTWGEYSGQPAYAARLAWTHRIGDQDMTLGAGGYYGRQFWGYQRHVDGWAGTLDLKFPLGGAFEFTSQFYRGRALGGLGGGIGQSVLWEGPLFDPTTEIYGVNSLGGWAQLKYRATSKLQFNGAFGQDNPFASNLREFGSGGSFYGQLFSKNQTVLTNFIYQPRSDFVLSFEYRRLKTFILDTNANAANVFNLSLGYIF